jgi:phospholipid/cholesterol/gamma-HCH transport system substrate-binding protein
MYDYIKHIRWAKLKVGLVITIATVIVFLAVMFAGNIEKIFLPKVKLYAGFSDVKGLREGSPVWFSGVEIGAVKKIQFTEERKIKVEMLINSDIINYLKKDSLADILTLGLLGDKFIEITSGSRDSAGLEAGDTISGISHVEIQDMVETGQESIANLSEFITTLEGVLINIEHGEGTISKFIKDPSLYDNLDNVTRELTDLVVKLKGGKGTLSKLLSEDTVYSDISISADNAKKFTERLQNSEGTINKLIEDKSLYENFDEVTGKLNGILGKIEKGEGFAGSLLKDDELADELKSVLKEMSALMKDVRENPRRYFKFSFF